MFEARCKKRSCLFQTKLIFLCSPNNPTGTIITAEKFEAFFEKVPKNILVVVDQAYAEYVSASNYPKLLKRLVRESNLMVLRTFSKVYRFICKVTFGRFTVP